jgi:hypothetical protein
VGDRLWLRERWTCLEADPRAVADGVVRNVPLVFEADRPPGVRRFQPPATMPRWGSRAVLTVREAEVRRLSATTADDARREDVMGWMMDTIERWPRAHQPFMESWREYTSLVDPFATLPSPLGLFAKLWDSRLGPGFLDWSHDPLVWVVRFDVERHQVQVPPTSMNGTT